MHVRARSNLAFRASERSHRSLTTISVVCIWALHGFASAGGDPLESGIREAARQIAAVMEQEQKESVTLLGVQDDSTTQSTIAGGLESLLREELERAGKVVKGEGGAVGVRARVSRPRVEENGGSDGVKLRIRFELLTANGEPLPGIDGEYLFPQTDQNDVFNDTVLGKDGRLKRRVPLDQTQDGAAGINADFYSWESLLVGFGGTGAAGDQGELFVPMSEDAFVRAKGAIEGGNEARLVPDSPFGLRILDAHGNPKPLRKTPEGHPFVEFKPDERFAIEVLNRTNVPFAATVMVDGLNTFHFSEEKSKHGDSWIMGKDGVGAERLVLRGWYKRNGVQDQFAASTFEASKRRIAGLGRTPVGAISVVISTAIVSPRKSKFKSTREVPREGGGTAKVNVQVETTYVSAVPGEDIYIAGVGDVSVPRVDPSELVVGRPLEVISIRYRDPKVGAAR